MRAVARRGDRRHVVLSDWESARPSPRRSRFVAAITAVALVVAAGVLVLRDRSRTPSPALRIDRAADDDAGVTPAEPAWGRPRPGVWRTMPQAPMTPRIAHAMVWAGGVVVVWGGVDATGHRLTDGGVFDPVTGTWAQLPPSTGTDHGQFAVTSTDVDVALVSPRSTHRWDPFRNTWIARPPPPLPRGHRLSGHVVGAFGAVVALTRPRAGHPDATSRVFTLRQTDAVWHRLPDVPVRVSGRDAVFAADGRITVVTRPRRGRPASVFTRPLADDDAPWTRVDPPPGLGDRQIVRLQGAVVGDRTMLIGIGRRGTSGYAATRDWWR